MLLRRIDLLQPACLDVEDEAADFGFGLEEGEP